MSYQDTYPNTPGYQNTDTSKLAAQSMIDCAATLRNRVYQAIHRSGDRGMTSGEVAKSLGLSSPHDVSPRVTELRRKQMIYDSGQRRRNESGRTAIVWIRMPTAEELLS